LIFKRCAIIKKFEGKYKVKKVIELNELKQMGEEFKERKETK